MKSSLTAGDPIREPVWRSLVTRAKFECFKWDAQSEDHCVLARFPLWLGATEWSQLSTWAEHLAAETIAAESELLLRPELHATLGLPRAVRHALARAAERPPVSAARVMRFDFHDTREGWKISEVNSDVPGGFVEGSGFSRLVSECLGKRILCDPAEKYAEAVAEAAGGGSIALVHATAHSDDRQVMEYLAAILRARGLQAVPVSPSHVQWERGRARLVCPFAQGEPAVLLRFYPAEWLPSLGRATAWEKYFGDSITPQSNPGSALLVQSKRFPLVWDQLRTPLPTWRALLPETKGPGILGRGKGDWVVKPALGRVGEDIGIEGLTPKKQMRAIRFSAAAFRSEWVEQRRFEAIPLATADGLRFPCLGVFTVDGKSAGMYGRLGAKPMIDQDAQDVAVLVQ